MSSNLSVNEKYLSLTEKYRPSSITGQIETDKNIFSAAASEYSEMQKGVDSLDIKSLKDAIAEDVAEAEAKANEKTSAEKTAKGLAIASGVMSGVGLLSTMGLFNAQRATSNPAQAASAKKDYTKMDDATLTSKLQEYTNQKSAAEKTINEQTTVSRAQVKIIDDIKAGEHAECKALEGLKAEVSKLDLENGTDPLVDQYKQISGDLSEINKGAEGTLPECVALKTAQETKIYKKEVQNVNGQQQTVEVEDTEAEQKAIKAAQDKLQAKQKKLATEQENKKRDIDNEKSKREAAVKAQEQKITGIKNEAIKLNGEACNKIANATTDFNSADVQIKAIQTEQSSRAVKRK